MGGGIFILDSSRLQQRWLTVRQRELLMDVCGVLDDEQALLMKSIIGHYYATYILQGGMSKQVAASLPGHADTAFLERTYCHPQDMVKHQAADLMQDMLNSQSPCHIAFMESQCKKKQNKKAG